MAELSHGLLVGESPENVNQQTKCTVLKGRALSVHKWIHSSYGCSIPWKMKLNAHHEAGPGLYLLDVDR